MDDDAEDGTFDVNAVKAVVTKVRITGRATGSRLHAGGKIGGAAAAAATFSPRESADRGGCASLAGGCCQ